MTIWCADFQASPDSWVSGPGTYETTWIGNPCTRAYIIAERSDFDALVAAAAAPGASEPAPSQFTPSEVTALKAQALTGLTIKIEPKPADPEAIQDYTVAFGLAFMALLSIWGGKQLYNFFNRNPSSPD